jgi:hypothetical protein
MLTTIRTVAEIEPLIGQIRAAADRTSQPTRGLLDSESNGIEVLRRMKFTEVGWHPMTVS